MKHEQKNLFYWLMIFKTVAEQGSFTVAAEQLGLTKSGVSQHVSRLEQHLQVQLLIRSTRSLSLTSAGKKLLARADDLKVRLDIMLDEMHDIQSQPTGQLSITVPQALAQPLVLPALQRLSQQFPYIEPQLIVDDGQQDIVKRGIDIAIRVGELQSSDLKVGRIGQHSEIFVASHCYVSQQRDAITQRTIEQHPFIATDWQTGYQQHPFYDGKGEAFTLTLTPKFEVNSANIAIELALLDLGIALIPDLYARQMINAGKLQMVLPGCRTVSDNIYYVHAYHENVPLKVKWFIEFLRQTFQQLVDRP